jgi:DNA polymerase-3 subunit gamma/tau
VIAREAAGSMRDAMSLLDQVIAWGGASLTGEDVARVLGVASRKVLHDIASALVQGDAARTLDVVATLANQGYDTAHVARDLLALLRDLVVAKVCKDPKTLLDLADEEVRDVQQLAESTHGDDLIRLHQGFSQGFDDVVRSGQPRAALEMLLVRLALGRARAAPRRAATGGSGGRSPVTGTACATAAAGPAPGPRLAPAHARAAPPRGTQRRERAPRGRARWAQGASTTRPASAGPFDSPSDRSRAHGR